MDRFATLEPVKLYATAATSTLLGRGSQKAPQVQPHLGRLPVDLYISILTYLAIPDVPAFCRTSRKLAELGRDERVWERKWRALGIEGSSLGLTSTLDEIESRLKGKSSVHSQPAPSATSQGVEDDFGEFASAPVTTSQDLFGSFQGISLSSHPAVLGGTSQQTYRQKFIRVHTILKNLLPSLSSPPHLVLTALFPVPSPPLIQQSRTLHLLALYLSPSVRPVRNHETLYASLRSAIDRFQSSLLSAFDVADGKKDEEGMREAARASWDVWDGHISSRFVPVSDWEMGRVWAEKREIFYEQESWNPLDNFRYDYHCLIVSHIETKNFDCRENALDFTAMDSFMSHILDVLRNDGKVAVKVFPKESYVVLSYAEKVAQEVVSVLKGFI